jgi:hypothetical protein
MLFTHDSSISLKHHHLKQLVPLYISFKQGTAASLPKAFAGDFMQRQREDVRSYGTAWRMGTTCQF